MGKILLPLALLLILFVWFYGEKQTDYPVRLNQTPVRIAVSTSLLSAPVIIADKLEFFAREGIYVVLHPLQGGDICFEALVNHRADLATSSESVVMFNSFKRTDFTVLASFAESDNDIKLLTLHKSGITTPAQLDDKRVGIVTGSASEYFLDTILNIAGPPAITPIRVNIRPSDLAPALLAGDVDAISVWEPYSFQLLKQHPGEINEFSSRGLHSLSFNLISRKADNQVFYEHHVRILKALKRASEFIVLHPEEANRIVADFLQVPTEEIAALWPDYLFRLSLGNSLLSNLQSQGRWAMSSGTITAKQLPDFRSVIDPVPLDQVQHMSLVEHR
ncbi:ABC transporter substrate-binding protein [Shewanella algae]